MRQLSPVRRRLTALAAAAAAAFAVAGIAVSNAAPAAAAAPPEVFSGFRNAVLLSGSTPYVATLNVPAGSYFVTAKLSAFSGVSSSAPKHNVFCELRAGANFDRSFSRIAPGDEQTLTNNVVNTFTTAGVVRLECNDTSAASGATLLEFVKLTAIRVNPPISNIALP